MEVILIEKSDFDRLVGHIEEIAEHIRKSESKKSSGDAERWISNKEAMEILGVSPRTLQRYRDSGCIPFSKIGKNCRYRLSDIWRVLEAHMIDGAEEKPEGLHRQYLVRTRKAENRQKKT
ncbi:helix-turn-helix domain-containing protein [Phocaeicola vulgatus]|uniref:Helix-turn-helix domain-containing protein n=1 Tax=Phocaeicola vulgatus TaxID=821 RepID=A0A848QXQ5_PHOVU|nr:helix-turn-helix domain-containing protein [Phocaeicola vulgatus]NMW41423.1 helix-turn-helix domain-containing protein [Phocaeicola vulgatus]